MTFTGPTLAALELAVEIRKAAAEGDDYGDSFSLNTDWSTMRTALDIDVWYADGDRSVATRILDIRRVLGGTFTKNDPEKDSYNAEYAMLTQERDDFIIRLITQRGNTCVRREVSVEMIEHPATEAYTERRPVYTWDCEPLNQIIEDTEPAPV